MPIRAAKLNVPRTLVRLLSLSAFSMFLAVPQAVSSSTRPPGPDPFYPRLLISPMRDDIPYSPVGMGLVTSKAGFRIHPVTGRGDFHSGVDLGARLNQEVYNLLEGIVTRVGWRGALGYHVEVFHPYPYPGVRTILGHLNAYCVRPGEWVCRGRVVGYAGTTGRSTGVHVHYTVIKEDTHEYIEPMQYLKLVPQYVTSLKSARHKAALAFYKMNSKQNLSKLKKIHVDDEEEPPEKDEVEIPPKNSP